MCPQRVQAGNKEDSYEFQDRTSWPICKSSLPTFGSFTRWKFVSCTCCGKGVIEIKCPYSIRDSVPAAAVDTANFYLEHSEGGIMLSTTHAYYYQIQGQLAICDRPYCDFVCWTTCGMHLERDPMVWDEIQPKLDLFYVKVILPQILCPNTTSIVDETSCSS